MHGGEPLLRIDPDITRLTQFGRSTIYREIAAGRLRAIRIGRATRIRYEDLQVWLDRHTVGGVDGQIESVDPSSETL
jgi:excisionase family DNA binding protein